MDGHLDPFEHVSLELVSRFLKQREFEPSPLHRCAHLCETSKGEHVTLSFEEHVLDPDGDSNRAVLVAGPDGAFELFLGKFFRR